MKKAKPKPGYKGSKIKIRVDESIFSPPRRIEKATRTKAPDLLIDLKEVRELKTMVGKLQSAVDELLRQQGATRSDFDQMRKDLFLTNLQKGMKDRKSLKKKAQKRSHKLLEKCGVKSNKVILDKEDVERIKTRLDLS